jgi:hypothetical protein
MKDTALNIIRKKLHGFVYALLTVTRTTLADIEDKGGKGETKTEDGVKHRQAKLASAFRRHMTEDQSYQGQNAYRKGFYKNVTELAEKVSFP